MLFCFPWRQFEFSVVYPVSLTLSQFRPRCSKLICQWYSDNLPQISSKSVQYSCEAKEKPVARDRHRRNGTTRQGEMIMPPCSIGWGAIKRIRKPYIPKWVENDVFASSKSNFSFLRLWSLTYRPWSWSFHHALAPKTIYANLHQNRFIHFWRTLLRIYVRLMTWPSICLSSIYEVGSDGH